MGSREQKTYRISIEAEIQSILSERELRERLVISLSEKHIEPENGNDLILSKCVINDHDNLEELDVLEYVSTEAEEIIDEK